jgi:DNA-binding transcriptional regulator YiaG
MTEEEVEAAALSDPDAPPLTGEQLARAFRPAELVALRARLGLDQAQFASRFRIDLDTLRSWERGLSSPEDRGVGSAGSPRPRISRASICASSTETPRRLLPRW